MSLRFDHANKGSGLPEEAEAFFPAAVDAVTRFRDMYQRWPVPERGDGSDTRATIAMLRGVDKLNNPMSKDFLAALDEPVWRTRYDPWGNLYRMRIAVNGQPSVQVGTNTVPAKCVFWSIGPDGVDQFGAGDDLISWERPEPAEAPAAPVDLTP